MSTNEQTPLSQPTSVVRNTLGKEQVPQDPGRPIFDKAQQEYCDRNYYQILPIIAEKVHQEKVQQEKLKAVKARLNFEETSRHSESRTLNRRRDLKERLGPRHARSMSGSPESRGGRAGHQGRRAQKGKSIDHTTEILKAATRVLAPEKQSLPPRNIITKEHPHEERKHYLKVKVAQEYIGSQNQKSKSQALRTTYPNHGHIKTYDGSEDPKVHLKIFQATAKTERWAMPTWCHMFNFTLTGNARVWFDDLPQESIDSYDDLRKVFLESYLQQKNTLKTRLKFTTSSREMGSPRKNSCE
ncbi:reverse transcriptase domain-containing protein, partial [Tanacetum coccineum]